MAKSNPTPSVPQAYRMPVPTMGQCEWKPDRHSQPILAFITKVGVDSVSLTIFAPDNRAGIPKDGVRHISDPVIDDQPGYDAGCWDFVSFAGDASAMARLALVEQQLSAIRQSVDELRSLIA